MLTRYSSTPPVIAPNMEALPRPRQTAARAGQLLNVLVARTESASKLTRKWKHASSRSMA